jgi:hypothetical protein
MGAWLAALGSPPVSPPRLRCLMRRERRQRIHGPFLSQGGCLAGIKPRYRVALG